MFLTKWIKTEPSFITKAIAECLGCMMFHFIGSVSPTPWANGIALITLVYYTAKTSGGHLNPAVSTTFMALGHITPLEMLGYWAAQITGCAFGALWIAALVPELYPGHEITNPAALYHSGCFIPKPDLAPAQIYGWEAVCTLCFIAPIFAVVWYTQQKHGYGNTGPIVIGLSLLANAFVAGQFTGAALNPARALGSEIIFKCPKTNHIWYYVLGELTAGLLSPLVLIQWYGIAPNAWYMKYLPKSAKTKLPRSKSLTHIPRVLIELEDEPISSPIPDPVAAPTINPRRQEQGV